MPESFARPLLLLPSLLAASCLATQSPQPPEPVGDRPARVLEGWAADKLLGWRVAQLFVLGGARDASTIPVNLHAKDIAVDLQNRVFLLDRAARRVLIYAASGEYSGFLGRAGRGRGELASPSGIAVSEAGDLWVWDSDKRSLVGFGPSGTMLPERPIASVGTALSFRFLRGDTLLIFEARQDTLVLSEHAGGSRKPISSFVRDSVRMLNSSACRFSDIPLRPLFSATLLWDSRADTVAINEGGGTVVRITARNQEELLLRRFLSPRSVTRALANVSLREGRMTVAVGEEKPCRIPPQDILQSAGTAPVFPAYSDVMLVPNGLLWAIRYRAPDETGYKADVFSLQTGYVGTLLLGAAHPVMARPDGTLISLEAVAGKPATLTIYRVERPQ